MNASWDVASHRTTILSCITWLFLDHRSLAFFGGVDENVYDRLFHLVARKFRIVHCAVPYLCSYATLSSLRCRVCLWKRSTA